MEVEKVRINVISDIDEEIWTSQLPNLENSILQVSFTRLPVPADIYLVYGVYIEGFFNVDFENLVFVCPEPREIQKYSRTYLKQFGSVYAADIPPYNKLANFRASHPYLPWHVGLVLNDGRVVVNRNWEDLALFQNRADNRISVITSNKILTKVQRKRIRFIQFLEFELGDQLVVYGRDRNFLADKGTGLNRHKFHVALENTISRNYWTEKLADPILMKNVVFYAGCPNFEEYFDKQVIEHLDLDNFDASLKVIRDRIVRPISEQEETALESNKRVLMWEHSIYRLLLDLASNYQKPTPERTCVTLKLNFVVKLFNRVLSVIRSMFIFRVFIPIYRFLFT